MMQTTAGRSQLPVIATAAAVLGAALLGFAATTDSPTIIIGILAIAVCIAILWKWTIGVPVLLVLASTDGFIKHYSASGASFVLKDAILAVMLLSLALRLGMHAEERPDATRWRGAIMWGVYVAFLATQIIHPAFGITQALEAFRAHAGFSILFVVGAIYFQRRERLARIANLAIVLCSWCACSALIQHAMGSRWLGLGPGFAKASLHYTAWSSSEARMAGEAIGTFRMYGTLVDPASLGLACTFGVLFAVAALARLHGIARLLAMGSIPLMATGLALSQARADMAGLAAGLLVLAILSMRIKAMRGFAIGGLVLIALAVPIGIVATHGSVLDRLLAKDTVAYAQETRDRSRDQVLNDLVRYPFGHGMGAVTSAGVLTRDTSVLSVDNVYYANLYETGIVGLALFAGVQLTFLILGLRAAARAEGLGAKTVFVGFVAAQTALLVSSWYSQGSFDYAPLAQFFWVFSGAVARGDAWAPAPSMQRPSERGIASPVFVPGARS